MTSEKILTQHTMVELKTKVESLSSIRKFLIQNRSEKIGVFHQVDTYYRVPKGRFKLREVDGKTEAELIYYERDDMDKPKRDSVFLLKIQNPRALKMILKRILKIKAVVDKVREIFIHNEVQVHLDTVKTLGYFVEFEYISSQSTEQQKKDMIKNKKMLEELREKIFLSDSEK